MQHLSLPLFVLLLLIAPKGFSQGFAPIGAKWTYQSFTFPMSPYYGYNVYPVYFESIKDTTINNIQCRKIQGSQDGFCYFPFTEFYVYDDSNRVYILNPLTTDFTLLYDFNTAVGDSWIIYVDTCPNPVYVDSIKTINQNGISRKVLHVSINSGYFSGLNTIVEGIGFTQSFMYPEILYHVCLRSICDGNIITCLRCYEDSLGLYKTGTTDVCDTLIRYTSVVESNIQKVKLYPNPVKGQLIINGLQEALSLNVFDLTGKKIYRGKLGSGDNIVDLSALNPGIYLIELTDKSGNSDYRRIVKL